MNKAIHRVLKLIDYLGVSARRFDLSIGAANGYTLRMYKNNASVGSDVIERIIKVYPQINLIWLITGKGNMLIKEKDTTNPAIKTTADIETFINKKLNEKWTPEKKLLFEEILKEIEATKNE